MYMYIKTGRDAWSFQITLGIPALQNVFMKYSKNTSTLNEKVSKTASINKVLKNWSSNLMNKIEYFIKVYV